MIQAGVGTGRSFEEGHLLVPGQARSHTCRKTGHPRPTVVHQVEKTNAHNSRTVVFPKPKKPRILSGRRAFDYAQALRDFRFPGSRRCSRFSASRRSLAGWRDEPGTSWSRTLPQSHNTAIPGHFSCFELHGVHRIAQTAHTLRTLAGGPISELPHGYPLGNCAILLHPVSLAGRTI